MTSVLDLDGNRRLDRFSGCVDMGAYEFAPRAVCSGCINLLLISSLQDLA